MTERDGVGGREDEKLWRELALRLLSGVEPAGVREMQPYPFVGEMPQELDAEIPVPDGLSLVGGLVRHDRWHGAGDTEVVLDASTAPEAVLASFRELSRSSPHAAEGWEERRWPAQREGGFTSEPIGERTVFRSDERGTALIVGAYQRETATDVRLLLSRDARADFGASVDDSGSEGSASVIPVLRSPRGAHNLGEGGRDLGETAEVSTTSLRTDLDPVALIGHYSAQLAAAGWTQTESGSDGPVAWTVWRFHAEGGAPWEGRLSAARVNGSDGDYRLRLSVHQI